MTNYEQQQFNFLRKSMLYLALISCLGLMFSAYHVFFNAANPWRLANIFYVTSYFIAFLLSKSPDRLPLSRSIFAFALLMQTATMYYLNGMHENATLAWLFVTPLFIFIVVGTKEGFWAFGFNFFIYCAGILSVGFGLIKPPTLEITSLEMISVHALGMSLVFLVALTRLFKMNRYTIEVLKKNVEIEKQANHEKDIFLSNMSHELRTPLNGIYGVLQIIDLKTQANTKDKELVSSAKWATESLTRIVNDILDMQKLIGNKIQLYPQWAISRELFSQAVHLYRPITNTKNVALNFVISENVPAHIYCDELRLGQILNNVLGNAIKFTEQGSIDLIVDYENNKLVIIISDTGIGMDETALSHLYDRFTQADSSTTKKYGGTGLGMAITKQLVELMNGTIDVESKAGKGSTFTIKIPLEGQGIHSEPSNQSLIIGI